MSREDDLAALEALTATLGDVMEPPGWQVLGSTAPIRAEAAYRHAAQAILAALDGRGYLIAAARAPQPELDVAWRAAEEALPEGWRISTLMIEWDDKDWMAEAEPHDPNGPPVVQGTGPTPAAALRALAAALGAVPA